MLKQDADGDIVFCRGSYRMFVAKDELEEVITFLTKVKEENERSLSSTNHQP
jgi:hypothetical protein